MEPFLTGFEKHCRSDEEFQTRWELLLPYFRNETAESVKRCIVYFAGKELNQDGSQRWPYCVSCLMNKERMCSTDMVIWSSFCFYNNIPFGVMLALPFVREMIPHSHTGLYMALMDSWSLGERDKMWTMNMLCVKDAEY